MTNPKKAAYNRIYNRTSVGCGTIVLLAFTLIILAVVIASADQFQFAGTIDSFFSPKGGATEAIVKEINSAKQEILVQAYSFTNILNP